MHVCVCVCLLCLIKVYAFSGGCFYMHTFVRIYVSTKVIYPYESTEQYVMLHRRIILLSICMLSYSAYGPCKYPVENVS